MSDSGPTVTPGVPYFRLGRWYVVSVDTGEIREIPPPGYRPTPVPITNWRRVPNTGRGTGNTLRYYDPDNPEMVITEYQYRRFNRQLREERPNLYANLEAQRLADRVREREYRRKAASAYLEVNPDMGNLNRVLKDSNFNQLQREIARFSYQRSVYRDQQLALLRDINSPDISDYERATKERQLEALRGEYDRFIAPGGEFASALEDIGFRPKGSDRRVGDTDRPPGWRPNEVLPPGRWVNDEG